MVTIMTITNPLGMTDEETEVRKLEVNEYLTEKPILEN